MEGLLTTSELTHALFKVMKDDSSPGIDGFTVNYLRVFWTDIKTIVKNVLKSTFTEPEKDHQAAQPGVHEGPEGESGPGEGWRADANRDKITRQLGEILGHAPGLPELLPGGPQGVSQQLRQGAG